MQKYLFSNCVSFRLVLQLYRVDAPGSDGRARQSRWGCGDRSDKPTGLHRPGAATARTLRQGVPLRAAWQRGDIFLSDSALSAKMFSFDAQISSASSSDHNNYLNHFFSWILALKSWLLTSLQVCLAVIAVRVFESALLLPHVWNSRTPNSVTVLFSD